MRAKNEAGISEPSNVVGPVRVDSLLIVDEMRDMSRIFASGGSLAIESREPRKAKEDIHRLRGSKGDWLVYRTLNPLRSATVRGFFEREVADFEFLVSADGVDFTPVQAARRDHFKGAGDYGYWKPVTFEIADLPSGRYFLKLVFNTDAQISNVEVEHRR
ncbi:MAG TPA: hypothetical protein VNO14_00745 [Blastocatellia bacterium]|nr:hypothetical protein [Blastocatellia bacterium]